MKNRKARADGGYIMNVSFTAKETSLLSWADMQGNFSNYVKQLIKADMEKEDTPSNMVETLLLTLLKEKGLKLTTEEALVDKAEQEPQPKPKENKSKMLGLMTKRNKSK